MLLCDYGTEVEQWKVQLIVSRAKRLGFADHDLADAQQEVILDVMAFKFDEAKSNGATEATALTAIIDCRLRAIRRSKVRYKKRLEQLTRALGADQCERSEEQPVAPPEDSTSLVIDVRDALAKLSPEDQALCMALAGGKTIRQIAGERGCSWSTVKRQVERIRRRFESFGLESWLAREGQGDGCSL